jgi:hypothetical protein
MGMGLGFKVHHEGTKAFCLISIETKRIIKSRYVVFIEGSKEIRGVLHPKKLENVVVPQIVNTRNQCPSRALPSITPEEAWSGRKPCVSHMRVFGCILYAMVPDEKRGKLDAKGTKRLFLGYCEGTKAYRLMCVQSKKIIKCRDVEFM